MYRNKLTKELVRKLLEYRARGIQSLIVHFPRINATSVLKKEEFEPVVHHSVIADSDRIMDDEWREEDGKTPTDFTKVDDDLVDAVYEYFLAGAGM